MLLRIELVKEKSIIGEEFRKIVGWVVNTKTHAHFSLLCLTFSSSFYTFFKFTFKGIDERVVDSGGIL